MHCDPLRRRRSRDFSVEAGLWILSRDTWRLGRCHAWSGCLPARVKSLQAVPHTPVAHRDCFHWSLLLSQTDTLTTPMTTRTTKALSSTSLRLARSESRASARARKPKCSASWLTRLASKLMRSPLELPQLQPLAMPYELFV